MPTMPAFIIRESFTWTDPLGSPIITFNVTDILAAITDGHIPYQRIETPVDPVFCRKWLTKRDLNMPYVLGLAEEPRLHTPVLGAAMSDGTVLLIDGSHRYAAHFIRHIPTIRFHVVAEEHWRPFATEATARLRHPTQTQNGTFP